MVDGSGDGNELYMGANRRTVFRQVRRVNEFGYRVATISRPLWPDGHSYGLSRTVSVLVHRTSSGPDFIS